MNKETLFQSIEDQLKEDGYSIDRKDWNRPWGGFFVIEEAQTQQFITQYFPQIDNKHLLKGQKFSPKILVVAPNKRLSWQYHFRRSEVWRVVKGSVGVSRSKTDEQSEVEQLSKGDWITLEQGERHRLIGLDDWGIVSEIWQHTDADNLSDENDIVRLQDDFGR